MQLPVAADFKSRLRQALEDCIAHNRLPRPPEPLLNALVMLGEHMYGMPLEKLAIPFPKQPPEHLEDEAKEEWAGLTGLWELAANEAAAMTPPILEQAVIDSLTAYVKHWPKNAEGPFPRRYADAVDFPTVCYEMTAFLRDEHLLEVGACTPLREQWIANLERIKKQQGKRSDEFVYPQEFTGPREMMPRAYFAGMPFLKLMEAPVGFGFKDEERFEHQFVVGNPGHGKSTYLRHLIQEDIKRLPNASLVIMDPKASLIDGFARLPGIEPILIKPPSHLIPLNPFRLPRIEDTVDLLLYAFGSVFGKDLTQLQLAPMEYMIRAVAKHKKPTLDVLVRFLLKPDRNLIALTDQNTREYFKTFFGEENEATMHGIGMRIWGFRRNSTVMSMFDADTCELDFFEAFHEGKIILIDTDMSALSTEEVQIMGRVFIALLHQAMRKRVGIRNKDLLKPVFVYADELPFYYPVTVNDPKIPELLRLAREQKIGITTASQDPADLNSHLAHVLGRSTIQVQCVEKGVAKVTVRGKPTLLRGITEFKFPAQISNQLYAARYPARRMRGDDAPPELPDSAPN